MGEIVKRVGAQEEKQFALGISFMIVSERVDRVADASTVDLEAAYGETRMTGDRQLKHCDPLFRGGEGSILLVRRHGSRKEEHLIKTALFPATLRQEQMPKVHRIEGSAEQSQSHRIGSDGVVEQEAA